MPLAAPEGGSLRLLRAFYTAAKPTFLAFPGECRLAQVMRYSIPSPLTNRLCLVALSFGLGLMIVVVRSQSAIKPTPSALEANPNGWTDILPATDLKGWSRVPVPPTGKLGRDQWHVNLEN